jgi:hypothetical protein
MILMRKRVCGVLMLLAAVACTPADTDRGGLTGPVGTIVVNGATWSCITSATPLRGWRSCTGTVRLSITKQIPSGIVSAYFNYPDGGSFFHGQLNVGSGIAGTVTVNVVNDYVSHCVTPYGTTINVYDGPQSLTSAPLIATSSFTFTSGC